MAHVAHDSVTCATAQGSRESQEDRYVNELFSVGGQQYRFMAVLDGHGGPEVAQTVSELLPKTFIRVARAVTGIRVSCLLHRTIQTVERACRTLGSGSTLSIVCVPYPFKKAHVAVLGDSPVLVLTGGRQYAAPMHNVATNPTELARARARGAEYQSAGEQRGYIGNSRTGYWLQVSRALGDPGAGSTVERMPQLRTYRLNCETSILLATDGLWSSDEPLELWRNRMYMMLAMNASAQDFVNDGLGRYGKDNVTALAWHAKVRFYRGRPLAA